MKETESGNHLTHSKVHPKNLAEAMSAKGEAIVTAVEVDTALLKTVKGGLKIAEIVSCDSQNFH